MTTTLSGFTLSAPSAPTAAVSTASGSLDQAAVYGYKVTFVTGFGETLPSSAGTQTTTTSGSLLVTIPVGPNANVIARNIYRTIGGGNSYLLLATVHDNVTTQYLDLIADGSLGTAAPTANTAYSRQVVNGTLACTMPRLYSVTTGIVALAGGGQTNATQLAAEYNVIATCATIADSVMLPQLNANLVGMHVVVANDGAASCNVFPAIGQNASAGTNTAVAVAAAARVEFVAVSASAWNKVR